jgi:hypothetical protein
MNDSPSFRANQFANQAEEFARKGDGLNASNSHFRAAGLEIVSNQELYLLAMNDTKDLEAFYQHPNNRP